MASQKYSKDNDGLHIKSAPVADLIEPDLKVLFCGINPGQLTGLTGHHFARPGNRFWPALYAAGFTPRLLAPDEQQELLQWGCGITNVVSRTTASAAELSTEEIVAGGEALRTTLRRHQPRCLAILGIGTYQKAFGKKKAAIGLQPDQLEGIPVWLLPNPSGLNAHYTPQRFAELFRELKEYTEREATP